MASSANVRNSPYYEKLSGDVKKRYDEKIQKCGGIDPFTLKSKDLSTSPRDFPEITLYDITDYMIHSTSSYTKRFLDNYKGTEGYKHFESGFVLNIGSKKIGGSAIVKGKVKHSQRMNDTPLYVWILANLNGKMICAHCTCLAGHSETCSHVGALCFAMHKIAQSRETKSVTDILCKWNVPSFKQVSMSAAKDMTWRFPSRERATNESSFLEYCDSLTNLSDERIEQFLRKSHSDGDETALGTIIFSSEKKRRTNLRDEIFLASLYNKNYREKSLLELIEIGKTMSLQLSDEEVKEISKITLPGLKSKCALGLKRGRITGSNFKNCCITNINDPSITTIRRVISPTKNLDHVPSIRYQYQNKKKAISQYTKQAALRHKDYVYNECGLVINPNIPCFVGSPDGLISCSCHGDGCVEVKCLNINELDELDDFLTRKPNNILNKLGNQYSFERSHEYYYRIQLQINIKYLRYCDCIIWSPKKAFVVTTYADTEFWKVSMEKAFKFHEQVIMPELLAKFYTQKKEFADLNEERYEEDVECQRFELLALEIEVLESEECQDITTGSISPEAITAQDLSKTLFSTSQSKNCQQSSAFYVTGLPLVQQKQKDHSQSSEKSNDTKSETLFKDLMSLSLREICSTFSHHAEYLTDVYNRLIKETKDHYYPKDLPEFAAFDLVTPKQFEAMVQVAESNLVMGVEQHNSSDVIFDAIIAEWAYQVFRKKYNLNRLQAVKAVEQINFSKPDTENN